MVEYFVLDNDYNQKNEIVKSSNKDYNLSFIDTIGGVAKREYVELEKEDLKNYLTEDQMDNIDTFLYDKKVKSKLNFLKNSINILLLCSPKLPYFLNGSGIEVNGLPILLYKILSLGILSGTFLRPSMSSEKVISSEFI